MGVLQLCHIWLLDDMLGIACKNMGRAKAKKSGIILIYNYKHTIKIFFPLKFNHFLLYLHIYNVMVTSGVTGEKEKRMEQEKEEEKQLCFTHNWQSYEWFHSGARLLLFWEMHTKSEYINKVKLINK